MSAETAPSPTPATPRPGSLMVARIYRIPVYVTMSWLLLSLVLFFGYGPYIDGGHSGIGPYLLGASIVVMLLLTVLLHELGHAAAARRYRVGVRGITLELLGGFTELDGDAPTPRAEAAIALAGPAVSFLLAGIAGGLLAVVDRHSLAGQLLFQLAATNVLVGVFNVLPGLPLDGGRALRAAVWQITRDAHRAEVVAAWGGRIIAIGTVIGGLLLWRLTAVIGLIGLFFFVLIAGTLWRGASESLQLAAVKQRLPLISAGAMARPLFLVTTGTPLAEALRQRDESPKSSLDSPVVLGVSDSLGRVIALVSSRAVAAVPPERRPWLSIDEVAVAIAPTQRIPAQSSGSDVLAAVQANPESDLLVTVGEDVVGVLRVADVVEMLRSRGPTT